MADAATATSDSARASVVPWLGVLLVMLLSLNTLGGWVRLSGSGIAIPQWPLIHGSLLPPITATQWAEVRADWDAHQASLRVRVDAGELGAGNLGREPRDAADFKVMFWTEYAHRLLAALTAVVMAGSLTVVLRSRGLRARAGAPLLVAGALVVAQAALGGLLVDRGTATHFLFLHQGNAGAILACVLWAILALIERPPRAAAERASPLTAALLAAAFACAWFQLVAGALVAGARNAPAGSTALLDDLALHQWLHRLGAAAVVCCLALGYWQAWRVGAGGRLRLALQVAATFVCIQIVLGLASAMVVGDPSGVTLPLAHQLMGMCLFVAIGLATFDAVRAARERRADAPSLASALVAGRGA